MEKAVRKIGLFVWDQGGRLEQSIEINTLVDKLSKVKGIARCEMVIDPLAAPLLDSVKEDIQSGRIDRILWVGQFTPYQVKRIKDRYASLGMNAYLHGWCDLEEQGIALDPVPPTVRKGKARTLIRMAIARTRLLDPLESTELPASEALLIVGAGVSGLHTAASVADLGKRVFIVEKQSGVGGKVAHLSRFYPRICDPHCGLEFVLDRLVHSERVEFLTLSRLVSLEGGPGNFLAKIRTQPRYVSNEKCNACGDCMRVCPGRITEVPETHRVDSQVGAMQGGIRQMLQSTRQAVHPATPMPFPAAFVVEREHCPPDCRECEKVCPNDAIELDQDPAEREIRVGAVVLTTGWEPYPLFKVEEYGYGRHDSVISNLEMEKLLSMDGSGQVALSGWTLEHLKEVGFIQCAGSRDERHLSYCSSVCCSATLKQVMHFKEKVPNANCYVFYQHIRSSGFEEELYRQARELGDVAFIRDRPARVEEESGKLRVAVLDPLLDKKITMDLDLLVLAGGMCPSSEAQDLYQILGLPQNPYGFSESHHQCYPEESQRTGIYVGGCAREPMNVAQSIESSHRAAMKALQFMQGAVQIEPTYPVLDKTKCDQCKRCMEDCPFASFVFDEKEFPSPDLARCRQCGNCMGVCPLAAISIQNNTIKQTAAQIEVLENSFMDHSEPLILAFLCENDAYKAARSAVERGLPVAPNVVFIRVSCAGAVNNALVADALSIGVDGVLIAGCKEGQCHYVWGNRLVQKRSDDLSDKLQNMRIERERVRFETLEIRDWERYVELLNGYIADLKDMGPNPFKI